MIEKALKKLKLDAMIIQQGRLSDNKASVNKDDLLSMVRYGAEMVFSGGGGTITDEDIDAIIAKVTCCFQFSAVFQKCVFDTTCAIGKSRGPTREVCFSHQCVASIQGISWQLPL